MVRLLGSAFGLGLLPRAPGTWGTLAGVLLALLAWWLAAPVWVLPAAVVVLTVGAVPLARAAERGGATDPGWFVLDEVAGYLLALAWLPLEGWTLVGAFALFRLFDIWKPWPVRRLEAVPRGWGVMLDDLAAGVYANLVLRILIAVT